MTSNEEIYKEGGSPTNDDVWDAFQSRSLRGAKGKYVFKQLKNDISGNIFHEEALLDCLLNADLAPTLKEKLDELLV